MDAETIRNAVQGDIEAQKLLSKEYQKINCAKAIKWYGETLLESTNYSHVDGCFNELFLRAIYLSPKNTTLREEKDYMEAEYQLAVELEKFKGPLGAIKNYENAADYGDKIAADKACRLICQEYIYSELEWLEERVLDGDPIAKYWMGYIVENDLEAVDESFYQNMIETDPGYEKPFRWYFEAARDGYPYAMYQIGNCYKYGKYIHKDLKEAVRWYVKGVKSRDKQAFYALGECYRDGTGIKKNYTRAVQCFKKAVTVENTNAEYQVGKIYESDPKTYDKAARWYGRAACKNNEKALERLHYLDEECGNAEAQYVLGVLYQDNGLEFYEKAALQGHLPATSDLAAWSLNYGAAYAGDVYYKLLEEDNPAVLTTVVEMYSREKEIPFLDDSDECDYYQENTLLLYEKAYNQGYVPAIYEIGVYYKKEGLYKKALDYFYEAAEKGDVEALVEIGDFARDGHGMDSDLEEAICWYLEAVEKGSLRAIDRIGECYGDGIGVKQNFDKAVEWFSKKHFLEERLTEYSFMIEPIFKLEKNKPKEKHKKEVDIDEYKIIGVHDVLVRSSNFMCEFYGHQILKLDASVCIDTGRDIRKVTVPAWYCYDCKHYYITEDIYRKLKRQGRICCRITEESASGKKRDDYASNWAEESLLMEYGYSVAQNVGLSEKQRRRILSFIIDHDILDVEEIEWRLALNIKNHERHPKAVSKWEDDLEYIRSYRKGSGQFEIGHIFKKKYTYV